MQYGDVRAPSLLLDPVARSLTMAMLSGLNLPSNMNMTIANLPLKLELLSGKKYPSTKSIILDS